jgi:predicted dehydrogenase
VWNVATVGLLRELCGAIHEGRAPAAGATFEDGWRNQRVLDAARQAHAERRWVRVERVTSAPDPRPAPARP